MENDASWKVRGKTFPVRGNPARAVWIFTFSTASADENNNEMDGQAAVAWTQLPALA